MGIFERIKNAIWKHDAQPEAVPAKPAPSPSPTAAPQRAPAPAPKPVDIEAVLEARSKASAQKLNWRTSIVDLMKLVDLDPSLANRKELAQELGYTGDTSDSATMNIWLHKQVMNKLAASGGTVPASLRD